MRTPPGYEQMVSDFILLHEEFLQFDWLRAVVFQLNLKYCENIVKITNLLRDLYVIFGINTYTTRAISKLSIKSLA